MRTVINPIGRNVQAEDVRQIIGEEETILKKGDVILVRSDYKHEVYGDHYSVITGGWIQKTRGLRPNLLVLPPLKDSLESMLLDNYQKDENGAIVLLLDEAAAQRVMNDYGIHLSEGDLIIDKI